MALLATVFAVTMLPGGPGRQAPLAPRPAQAAVTGWTTYHYDNARDGNDTAEPAYGAQVGQALTSLALDGKVYASPLVWSGLVFVATENNTVYALRETDLSVNWSKNLAPPAPSFALACSNVTPVVGITGTPVLDPASGILYAVGLVSSGGSLKHQLWALNAASGGLAAPARDVVFADLDPRAAGQRGALALANGNVYIPFGGRAGDCSPYHTRVAAVPVNGGAILGYQPQGSTYEGAGLWTASGESVDAAGNLYIATGNGLDYSACPHAWDYSNAVIRLSPSLAEQDKFVPPNWCQLEVADADLGSVAPLLLPGGLAFTIGKSGQGWVLNTASLGGFSATVGTTPDACSGVYGGLAAAGSLVYVPCENELVAITNLSASGTPFSVSWHHAITVGAPIVVGGSIWALDEHGTNLRRIDPATGNTSTTFPVGSHTRFQTPAADSGRIFVAADSTIQEFNFGNITPPSPPTPPAANSGVLHTLATPQRLFDTRTAGPMHTFGSAETEELAVLGAAGIPAGNVSAVVLNVTAVNAQQPGFLAVFPGGTGWPQNSNVNFGPGGSASPNLVLAQVGANGKVAFVNGSAGTVDVLADAFAYFDASAGAAGPAGRYRPLTPVRVLDTRGDRTLPPSGQLTIPIAGHYSVPAGATAVALNVTAVNPSGSGFLAAFPDGTSWPGTSNLNFGPGDTVPNRVIVALGSGGGVTIANASGNTDVIVDVSGWFTGAAGGPGGVYTPVTPSRLVDARVSHSPLGPGQSSSVAVGGQQGVPLHASTAAVNVTVTDETAASFLAAYPDPGPWPGNSDLNTSPGRTSTNAVLVGLGGGKFDVIHASGSANVIVDLMGWFS